MPQVTTVKKAAKPQGECEKCSTPIKKGDAYRWWKFRFGVKHVVCMADACSPKANDLESLAEQVREFGEEQQGKFDNMPEGLQQGDTGQLLEERASNMEQAATPWTRRQAMHAMPRWWTWQTPTH